MPAFPLARSGQRASGTIGCMEWREILQALRMVGAGNAWRAWRYRQRKHALDAAYPLDTTLQGVGALHTVSETEHGARLTFAFAALEITFLAADVVRLAWEPGKAPPPYAIPDPPAWPAPDVAFHHRGETWRLRTDALEITITPDDLAFHSPLGDLLRRESWPARRGEGWRQSAWLHPEAAVFGLGERASGPNLRPGTYRLWNQDPGGHYAAGHDPLYITMPVAWVLQPAGAYLIFYDNPASGEVQLDDGFHVRFDHGALVAYFITGDAHIARRWAELTGFPALPPRWALGYHQSRWGYRTQREAEAVLDGFHQHQMPLAALHLEHGRLPRLHCGQTPFPRPAGHGCTGAYPRGAAGDHSRPWREARSRLRGLSGRPRARRVLPPSQRRRGQRARVAWLVRVPRLHRRGNPQMVGAAGRRVRGRVAH